MIINIFKELKNKKELQDLALKAYNNCATRMNNGILDTFNKLWESKGREFGTESYNNAIDTLTGKIWLEEAKKLSGKWTAEEIYDAFKRFVIKIK